MENKMSREEIIGKIEELEEMLDDSYEEDFMEEELKEYRKQVKLFKKQEEILKEEIGLTFKEIMELQGLANGGINITNNVGGKNGK